MIMTDREAVRLLRVIKDIALCGYPYPEGVVLDDRLALALGKIAGIVDKAVTDYEWTPVKESSS
jgi:hypothetical protein